MQAEDASGLEDFKASRVLGSGFGILVLRFRVYRVSGSGVWVQCFRVLGSKTQGLGSEVGPKLPELHLEGQGDLVSRLITSSITHMSYSLNS